MSDIDRVFARLGGKHPAGGDQRELRRIPRKGGSADSRGVEVVHLPARGSAASGGGPRRADLRVRAETWDEGFPAKSAPHPPSRLPQPAAAETSGTIAHVMPMWERTAVEWEVEPASPALSEAAQTPPPAECTRRTAGRASQRVADPFDPHDDGANRLRCGYVIQPARERRGLVTCARCR
jgi:hypothetical protein